MSEKQIAWPHQEGLGMWVQLPLINSSAEFHLFYSVLIRDILHFFFFFRMAASYFKVLCSNYTFICITTPRVAINRRSAHFEQVRK